MTADWFFAALRHDRAVVLGSLGLVVALAWAWLLLGAGIDMEEMDMGGGQMMLMPPEWSFGGRRRSGVASTLLACLELARDGKVEMRQLRPFDEIYVRDRGVQGAEVAQ